MADKKSKEIFEWIKSLIVAILLAMLIRYFVVEIFLVDGDSMYPTLSDSERLVVNKFVYRFNDPERQDIVVFEYSDDKDFIKRVIGLPGEEVKISNGKIYIDGQHLEEDYQVKHINDEFGPKDIPEDHYFVLGDNRNNSMDSRSPSVGPVNEEQIKGKAFFVFWPLDQMGLLE